MFSDSIILVSGASLSDRETILQALGDQCHVTASQTTEDALAHLTSSVDLVITEIRSTQVDGLELMRCWKLRQSNTPFLMLAGQSETALAVEAMKSGATDCVVKPIDADDLRVSVQQIIGSNNFSSRTGSDRNQSNGQHHKLNIDIPPDTSLEELERAAVEQALIQHHGNRTHAARTLGISVRTLQRKLKAWGMPIISFPSVAMNHSFLLSASGDTAHAVGLHSH